MLRSVMAQHDYDGTRIICVCAGRSRLGVVYLLLVLHQSHLRMLEDDPIHVEDEYLDKSTISGTTHETDCASLANRRLTAPRLALGRSVLQ
jgi:hypothetical protein